jgi:putative hydrolase of HD superfamily
VKRSTLTPSVERLLELQQLLLVFRNIKRVIHIPGATEERENDSEHSYSLAMVAWFLAQHFPHLDRDKIIRLALAHDLVEIHAGDTFFYADEAVLSGKKEKEQKAYEQIKNDWPDFPQVTEVIKEYEDLQTPESRFVYALDKIMPILMIYLAEGHTWKKEQITFDMLQSKKKAKVALSPEIDEYYQQLILMLHAHAHYFHE